MKKPVTTILLSLCLTNLAFANGTAKPSASIPKGHLTCPKVSQLKYDSATQLWGTTKKDWRSFAVSFTTTLHQFLGAQWQGINVGTLFCLYRGEKMTFTVNVQYHGLVLEPSGGKWTNNLKGRRNCVSHNIKECVFKPKAMDSNDTTAPNEQDLKSLRITPQQQPGF